MADNALLAEMHRAFNLLWEVWPSKFNTAEATRKVQMFAKPLHGIDVAVLLDAAQQWISNNRFAPTPAEFSAYAWRLHKTAHPDTAASKVVHRSEGALAEAARLDRQAKRFTRRAEYIKAAIGDEAYTSAALTHIWGLLYQIAASPAEVTLVREARVKAPALDEAVRLWKQQQRFVQGPIKVRVDDSQQRAVIA